MKRFYIFYCLLLFFFIFVLNLNISYAITEQEVIEMASQAKIIRTETANQTGYQNAFNVILDALNSNAYLQNKSDFDYENYTNLLIYQNKSTYYGVYFYFFNANVDFKIQNNYWVKTTNDSISVKQLRLRIAEGNISNQSLWEYTNQGTQYQAWTSEFLSTGSVLALVSGNVYNQSNYQIYSYNIYNYIVAHDITYNGLTYVADAKVGNYYNLDNINYKMYAYINDTKSYVNCDFRQTYGNGLQGQVGTLQIFNLASATNNEYFIEMYNNNDYLVTSNGFYITYQSSGNETSGDNNNNNGNINVDLTETNNKIDNVANTIKSGDAQIINAINQLESGEKARNDFWVDTYNSLFSLNSGDVNDIAVMIQSYFPSGDSPISIFDTIFGSINNEPDDFIIRWDDIPLHLTISGDVPLYSGDFIQSGSINFSKYCRDNSTLGVIHTWIIIFAVVSFYLLFIADFYRCILKILGVSSDLVDFNEEEHRQIGFINDWRDK